MSTTENHVQESGPHVIDLDELFLENARQVFETSTKKILKEVHKTNFNWEDLTKTLDYSNFLMETEDYDFRKTQPMKNSNHVVFKTTYSNTTPDPLTYTLNIERTTRNITTVKLNKGLRRSGNVGLKLKLPGDICELEGGYAREVSMERERETCREEEMVWSANTEVKVPPKTDTTMELVVEEHEYDGNFDCYVKLSGSVVISLSKGERELYRADDPDFSESLPRKLGFVFDEKTKTMRFRVSGNCSIRKGLRQRIKLSQCPNKDENPSGNNSETPEA